MRCDAVVSSTDINLSGSRGIDKDIHDAAGEELAAECRGIAPCPVGSVVITKGYKLSPYIIHAVAPVWTGDGKEYEALASCYRKVFALAAEYGCRSIAVPHISSGGFGFPPNDVLRIAVDEANEFLSRNNMDIYIVTHRRSTFNMSQRMYEAVASRIDDCKFRLAQRTDAPSLDELVSRTHESFRDMLLRKIGERGMKNSECYNKALVSKSVFSDIVNKPGYTPKKKTVAAFVIALELPPDEALDMFGKAGYYLTRNSKFDTILFYFIEQKKYDIFEINDALEKYGAETIGC